MLPGLACRQAAVSGVLNRPRQLSQSSWPSKSWYRVWTCVCSLFSIKGIPVVQQQVGVQLDEFVDGWHVVSSSDLV